MTKMGERSPRLPTMRKGSLPSPVPASTDDALSAQQAAIVHQRLREAATRQARRYVARLRLTDERTRGMP